MKDETKDNDNYVFNIALNYGSRQEIVKATKEIANEVKEGKLDINDINEETISNYLYTKGLYPLFSSTDKVKNSPFDLLILPVASFKNSI